VLAVAVVALTMTAHLVRPHPVLAELVAVAEVRLER
jgi:hypothetical protein